MHQDKECTLKTCPALTALSLQVEEALAVAEAHPLETGSKGSTTAAAAAKLSSTTGESAAREPPQRSSSALDPGKTEPTQAMLAPVLPPRKMKLQPGDFHIRLPKSPSAQPAAQPAGTTAPDSLQSNPARAMEESSPPQNGHSGVPMHESPSLAQPSGSAQYFEAQQHPEDTSTADSGAQRPDREGIAVPAGAHKSSAQELAQQQMESQDTAAQPNICMSNQQPEPFMDSARSPGAGYAAAAAKREEAQELALEQAILVRHFFQREV